MNGQIFRTHRFLAEQSQTIDMTEVCMGDTE